VEMLSQRQFFKGTGTSPGFPNKRDIRQMA